MWQARAWRRADWLAVMLAVGTAGGGVMAAEPGVPKQVSEGLSGYISMSVPAPPDEYRYGVSLYASAWPLLAQPLADFQIGLASIWIVPDNRTINEPLLPTGTVARDNWPERGPSYRDVFQTIEGGLGFWASTRFGWATAKFRMNGTPDGYNHEISSPGWGFGSTHALAPDQMGIAQLSNRLLVAPDGLTCAPGTCGELFGYAWMALPLTARKATTAGLPVTTGNQTWTMFLNTANFKGPVACYTPATWSRISRRHPPAVGRGLDERPGLATGGAIEINTVPRFVAQAPDGTTYTRIPRLQYPVDAQGRTVLMHQLTHYSQAALWRQVEAWVAGGEAPTGRFDPAGARVPPVHANPLELRQGPEHRRIRGCEQWVQTSALDASTFGLQWQADKLEPWTGAWRRGAFPEYCRREGNDLRALPADAVPAETGLAAAQFRPAVSTQSYTSPTAADSAWRKPGPRLGPFEARLADGSRVIWSWYRFIDQPALADADLSASERARLQALVERMHAAWTPDREYLPPPATGTLAQLDRALLVTPPTGCEVGYVPIVTAQTPG